MSAVGFAFLVGFAVHAVATFRPVVNLQGRASTGTPAGSTTTQSTPIRRVLPASDAKSTVGCGAMTGRSNRSFSAVVCCPSNMMFSTENARSIIANDGWIRNSLRTRLNFLRSCSAPAAPAAPATPRQATPPSETPAISPRQSALKDWRRAKVSANALNAWLLICTNALRAFGLPFATVQSFNVFCPGELVRALFDGVAGPGVAGAAGAPAGEDTLPPGASCVETWLALCAYLFHHRAWCHSEGEIVILSNDHRPWLLAELWRCRMHWLWAVRCVTAKKSRKNNPLSPGVGSSNLTAFLVSAFFVVLTFLALPEAREVR